MVGRWLAVCLAAAVLAAVDCGPKGHAPAATFVQSQQDCPVTGAPVQPSYFVDYEGKRVYFCCNRLIGYGG